MYEPMSWHFAPANSPRLIAKSLDSIAQVVILDLEDAVAQTEKVNARRAIAALAPRQGQQIWVRTNVAGTTDFELDLQAALANPNVTGALLPKAELLSQVPSHEALRRGDGEALRVGLLIESALGVLNLNAILSNSSSVAMVMFGGAEHGDLMSELGCDWSPSGIEMVHARQHVLLCARAHRVQPVDGVYARIDDLPGFENDTLVSRSFGFRARASVHPGQLEVIHRCYAPTPEEERRARRLVEAFEGALEQRKAAIQIDGQLVDYAMYRAAKRVLNTLTP